MKLSDLLEKFPHIRLAKESDNESILSLYEDVPMRAEKFALGVTRTPNYFSLLPYQGKRSFVFVFENQDFSVGGVAVYTLDEKIVNGSLQNVAYLSDLRTSPTLSRSTRKQWRQFHDEIILHSSEIVDFGNCRFMYGAILDENKVALRALTRKPDKVVYRKLSHYKTVSVLARLPLWPREKSDDFRIRSAEENEMPLVLEFIAQQSRNRLFGSERIRPPESGISGYLVVEDENGDLVGCLCPWEGPDCRKVVVRQMARSIKVLARTLAFMGLPPYKENCKLRCLYLSQFEVDMTLPQSSRRKICSQVLNYIFDKGLHKGFHTINFVDHDEHWELSSDLRRQGYVCWTTPATIYQVIHRSHYNRSNLIRKKVAPPSFEIAVM